MAGKVTAHGKLGDHDIEAEVLNPGGWYGKAWLIEVGCGYSSIYYVAEADTVQDAIDEFVGSDAGKKHVGIDQSDYGDYGHDVTPGDIIGGVTFDVKGKVNLRGEFFPEGDERGKYLSEPYTGDGGDLADLDNVLYHGQEGSKTPWPCDYTVEGLEEPVPSTEYGNPTYNVTRYEHGEQGAGFRTEDAAREFIDGKVKAGEGEDWEYDINEVACTYA